MKNPLSVFKDKRELLDPSIFDNEVAHKTSWEPLVGGGTNICTHRVQTTTSPYSEKLLCFKKTAAAIFFCGSMILIGTLFLVNFSSYEGPEAWIGLVIVLIGAWQLWSMHAQQSVFDRSAGRVTKGGKTHDLGQICAIQLIREFVSGNKSSYYSYELNLVRTDGERINIADHGSLHAIRVDAETLSNYLSIPVWDAIDYRIPEQAREIDVKHEFMRRNII